MATNAETLQLRDGRHAVIIASFAEAIEILRRRNDFSAHEGRGARAMPFIESTVLDADGQYHVDRRRLLTSLVSPDQLQAYQASVLEGALPRYLSAIRGVQDTNCQDVEFDLISLLRNIYWELAAQIVGLDHIHGADQVKALEITVAPAVEAELVLFSEKDPDVVCERGFRALKQFDETYFRPNLERRERKIAKSGSASSEEARIPVDLISLMLQAHPDEPELILRECIVFLGGAVSNPVATLAHSFLELDSYLGSESWNESAAFDDQMLDAVVRETLRLHRTGNPYLIRQCTRDLTLRSSGRRLGARDWVAVDIRQANRDPEVFGPDADSFRPGRTVELPQAKDYGLAFGSGPHMCLGKPLVVGDGGGGGGILRLQGLILQALLAEGVRVDRRRAPVREEHEAERFVTLPAILGSIHVPAR